MGGGRSRQALRALNIVRRFGGNEPIRPMEPILVCNDGAGASVVRREGFVEIDFENAHSFSSVNQKVKVKGKGKRRRKEERFAKLQG